MDLVRRVSGELLRSLSAESASLAEPAELSAPTRIDVDVYEADVEEPEWGWYDEQDPHLEPGAGPHGGGGAAHAAGPHGGRRARRRARPTAAAAARSSTRR